MPEVTAQLSTALADRYRIEKHLGEGGMATVYVAEDLKHDRKVAIKVLKPELAVVLGAERFVQEIKTTAALSHPHILPLFDSGEAGGFLYYVMPFIAGETIRDKLNRETQLGIEEAVRITTEVADALDYAHRHGVIHRDIKPENILLHDGRPMVMDFGIALALSAAAGGRMTETGLSLGTPHYMSPEQATADKDITARTDIYSLASVLYEMLTGEPPHMGNSAQQIIVKIIAEPVKSATKLRKSAPPHVAAALTKALEKLPADRFETAKAFADALGDTSFTVASRASATAAASTPTGRRRTLALVAVTAVLVGAGTFFAGRLTVPEPEGQLARFRVEAAEGVTQVSSCCGPQVALSPDGQWLAYRGIGSGTSAAAHLFRRALDQLTSERIPGTDDARQPFFSPDSRWLGFWADGSLRKVSMAGGPPVPITETAEPAGVNWGGDSTIVYALNGTLYTVPASGGKPKAVPRADTLYYALPSFLPDGKAVVASVSHSDDPRLAVVDLATGASEIVAHATRGMYASGYLVTSGADGTLLAQPFDPEARTTSGQALPLPDEVLLVGPSLVGEFFLAGKTGTLVVLDPAPGLQEALMIQGETLQKVPLTESGTLADPSFSPDGRRIAVQLTPKNGKSGIWVWDRDQASQPLLVSEAQMPHWTRDGKRVSFTSIAQGGHVQPYWIHADGSGSAERLFPATLGSSAWVESWTPDGRAVVRVSHGQGTGDIGLMTPGDSTIQWVVKDAAREWQGQVSPDGRWLAYTSDRSGQQEVYAQALDGSGGLVPISSGGGYLPRWAPDGRTLYYAVAPGQPLVAVSLSTDGGLRVTGRKAEGRAFSGVTGSALDYDVSPKDGEFVYVASDSTAVNARPTFTWVQKWPEIARKLGGGG